MMHRGFISVLQKLRVNATGANAERLGYTKTKKVRVRELVKVAGIVTMLAVTYTITYEHHSRDLVSVRRTEYRPMAEKILATTVVLYVATGTQIIKLPNDWTSATGKVECVGGGGLGAPVVAANAAGAGGGAWAKNDTAFLFFARQDCAAFISAGCDSADTWISNNGAKPTLVTQGCVADTATNAAANTPGLGGLVANCVGTASFRGGNGSAGRTTGMTFAISNAGGGGGAAGPGGRGGDSTDIQNSGGGAGNTLAGGDAGASVGDATAGQGANNSHLFAVSGTNWTDGITIIGTGSGGLQDGTNQIAPSLYGAGGGGMVLGTDNLAVRTGTQGCIIATYTHYVTTAAENMWKSQPENMKLRGRVAHSRTYLHRLRYSTYRQIPYHTIALGSWFMGNGGGVSPIRQIEPGLVAVRKTGPLLED